MRKIMSLVLIGILFYGCSSQDKAGTQGKTEADTNDMARTALQQNGEKRNSQLENNKQKLLKMGMEYLNQSKIPEAIYSFNQAVLLDPSDASSSFVLAQTYMHLKKYENALSVLDNVITMQPDNGQAYYLKGITSGLAGNKQQAIEAAQKSIAIFQEKKDENNFKRAIALLQGLSAANNPADLNNDSSKEGLVSKDTVSTNILTNSELDDSAGQKKPRAK